MLFNILIFVASASREPVRSTLVSNPSQGQFRDFVMKLPSNNFYHHISDKLPLVT